ncbi:MAG TPA: methyltransferase domain-containing protein [Acidimicrobiales bacterium]|nr:methyltransferase domain-containing protein [Acidimicrobiales bacterium]
MDRATVDIYDRSAVTYAERRRADEPERARTFAAAVPAGELRVDLGCGPGLYLPYLGGPVVAADAAPAMVAEAQRRHTGVAGVACDLEALPFRRGSVAGIWARKCLQHVTPEQVPLALAGLHRALRVCGVLDLTVFAGDGDRWTDGDDDFPGRYFALWRPDRLRDLIVGAGFEVEELAVAGDGERAPTDGQDPVQSPAPIVARARRARTLPDTVGAGMRLLVCGLNPSLYAADAGVGFARPGNRFWPAARAAGLVTRDRDADYALCHHGIGMTDLVKRATVAAAELSTAEYRAGLARVERLVRWLRPAAVCFVGLAGWRAAVDRGARAGRQDRDLAGATVYVMPSTSGLNARTSLDELTAHLRAAALASDG